MEEAHTAEQSDRTLVSLLCALTITLLSVVFFFVFELSDMIADSGRSFQLSLIHI